MVTFAANVVDGHESLYNVCPVCERGTEVGSLKCDDILGYCERRCFTVK